MHPRPTAVVPLKALGSGKSRLASHLDTEQRAVLARAMAVDVVAALRRASVGEVVLAAGDSTAATVAEELGLLAQVDGPAITSLDEAVAATVAALGLRGSLLVVAADLPCVQPEDIDRVVASRAAVAVAPTRDGGTAALLRQPGDVIATAYGRGSAARHRALARTAGASFELIEAPGLRRDVDTWEDLLDLRTSTAGHHTVAILGKLLGSGAAAGS